MVMPVSTLAVTLCEHHGLTSWIMFAYHVDTHLMGTFTRFYVVRRKLVGTKTLNHTENLHFMVWTCFVPIPLHLLRIIDARHKIHS